MIERKGRKSVTKKKKILAVSLLCIMSFAVINGINTYSRYKEKRYQDYCMQIKNKIEKEDFSIAKLMGNNIELFDDIYQDPISRIDFEEYDKSLKIIYIRKDKAGMYFVTKAMLDDERGYVIFNSNISLDGMKKIERIGGNFFYYSTLR